MNIEKTEKWKEEINLEKDSSFTMDFIHNLAPVGIYLFEDAITYINQEYAEIIGETYERIKNWTLNDFLNIIPSEYHDGLAKLREKTLRGERSQSRIVFPMKKSSGQLIYVQSDAKNISLNGKPAVLGTLVDITHLKKEEQKLLHRKIELDEKIQTKNYELIQERGIFNRFFDLNPNPIGFYNVQGQLVRSNFRYRKIFPNNKLSEYNLFNDSNFKFSTFKEEFELLRNGIEVNFREIHYKVSSSSSDQKETRIINFHAFPIFSPENKIENFAVMYEDFTNRYETRTQLLELEQKFKTFYDNSIVGFALVDAHGNIAEVNQAMVNIVGTMDKSDLVGHNILEFIQDYDFSTIKFERNSDSNKCDTLDEECLDACIETEIFNAGLESVHVEIRIREIPINGTLYYRSIVRDISDKVHAEQALDEKSKQVEYISAISVISSMFINPPDISISISRGLKVLGNALNANHISIYSRQSDESPKLMTQYIKKWTWLKNGFKLDEKLTSGKAINIFLNQFRILPLNLFLHDAIQNMEISQETKSLFFQNNVDYVLLVPIFTDDAANYGTMFITSDKSRGTYTVREISLAVQIATIFGFALSNENIS